MVIFVPDFLSDGLFMDGLIYGTISRNMSEGIGSLWHPEMSDTQFNPFHEHPPLQIYLTSFLFKIFPDKHYLIEKGLGVVTFLLSIFITIKIWNNEFKDTEKRDYWLLLTFLLIPPSVCFIYARNMLEIGVVIFSLLSLYLGVKSTGTNNYQKNIYIVLMGVSLFLGFLCKGFTALYPLVFFILRSLFFKDYKFKGALVDTFILVISFCLPLSLLAFEDNAVIYFNDYLNRMVLGAIKGENSSVSKFKVLGLFTNELLPCIGVCVILFIINKFALKKSLRFDKSRTYFYLCLGLCASLPLIVSSRQVPYYIAASYYPVALGLFFFSIQSMRNVVFKKEWRKGVCIFFTVVSLILAPIAINLQKKSLNKIREKIEREDLAKMSQILPPHTILYSLEQEFNTVSSFQAFFYREEYINVKEFDESGNYFLGYKNKTYTTLDRNYTNLSNDLELNHFSLYQKRE